MNKIIADTFQNIRRSGWRAYFVIFMMTATFVILGLLMTVLFISRSVAAYFAQKPEVIGFFKDEITEEQILEVKRDLEAKDFVAEVRYISKENAMKSFLEENKDNQEVIEAVTVNVFPAHLNVKAIDLDSIPKVADYFQNNQSISDVLASENVLSTLQKIVEGIKIFGVSLFAIFTIATIFIIFLTISITVYSHKDEIQVMKLVGATNSYVRVPYLLQSSIYGLAAVLISGIILIPLMLIKYDSTINFVFGELEVAKMGVEVLSIGIAIELIFALLLTLFSSFLATKRYINV